VQSDIDGHRRRKDDPLCRARRRLTMAAERLSIDGDPSQSRAPLDRLDPHFLRLAIDWLKPTEQQVPTPTLGIAA